MRTKFQIIALAVGIVFSFQSQAQTADAVFPKGDLSTVKNHTGNIWLKELNVGDSTFDSSIAVATYDPGAKLDWHIHPGGQVLLITEGTGYLSGERKANTGGPQGGCNQMSSGRRALARRITEKWLCLYSGYADSKGEDGLVRAG